MFCRGTNNCTVVVAITMIIKIGISRNKNKDSYQANEERS